MDARSSRRWWGLLCLGWIWMVSVGAVEAQSWFSSAWSSRKAITISRTNVTGTVTNFPVMVGLTDGDLQTYGRSQGEDLMFTSSDGVTKLPHEIESYASSNGTLVAWVKVPSLASTVDATLYLYFGNPNCGSQQSATNVWDSNFAGVWHLKEDPSGGAPQLRDSTAYGNNGTSLGGRGTNDLVAGRIGNAQRFDGTDDRISVPSTSSLQVGTTGSIEAWFKRSATGGWNALLTKGYDGFETNCTFYLDIDTSDHVYCGLGVGGTYSSMTSTFTVSDTTTFHLLQYTWDGSNGRLYYDGVLRQTTAQSVTPFVNSFPVTIGQWGAAFDRFAGTIDEVRISRVARSTSWNATQYRNQNSPQTFAVAGTREAGLVSHFAITSINGGATPTAGTGFSVQVGALSASGGALVVGTATAFTLSLAEGSGTLGGTLTGTIAAGTSSATVSGVTYTKAESGVILRASRTSGDALTAGDGLPFSVAAGTVSASGSGVSAGVASTEANGQSVCSVTVTLRDAYGNVVAGKSVSLAVSGTGTTVSPASGTTDATGAAVFSVRSVAAGSHTVSATDTTDGVAVVQTATVSFVETPWYNAAWGYRKLLTVDHAKVAGDLADFPVLVSVTDAELAARARTNAYDLVFTASDGVTKLAHEIERYSSSSGTLVAWVKVPSLSSTSDTRLFLYHGNASIGSQSQGTAAWDSGFRAVWHGGEESGVTLHDATANGNHGTLGSAPSTPSWDASGQVGPGVTFDGTNDHVGIPYSSSLDITGNALTISGWYRIQDTGVDQVIFGKFYGPTMAYPWYHYGVEFDTDAKRVDLFLGSEGSLYGAYSVTPALGTWTQVTFTYDGTNVVGYVNGQLEVASPLSVGLTSRPEGLRMGRDAINTQPLWGSMDELRVSAVARTPAWVATEYANQSSPGTFVVVTADETQTNPRLAITSVNGGASPNAEGTFSITIQALTAAGAALAVSQDTVVLVAVGDGTGTLGGTVTGLIPTGASSVTITGLTYHRAESGIILRATAASGEALTPGDSAPFTVVAGAVSTSHSSLGASPTSVEANGASAATVVVILRDGHGNPVSGKTVGLGAGGGHSTVTPASAVTDANGRVEFAVVDLVAETVTYTATDTTDGRAVDQTGAVTFVETAWFSGAWGFRKMITVDHTKVAGDLEDFPVLVDITDTELAGQAKTNGFDLVFTSADGRTKLAHEVERYSAASGNLLAWVKVPRLSGSTDTRLFLYYGNAAAGDQQNAAGVWDAGFRGVWHGGEGGGGAIGDSTSHNNDGALASSPRAPSWSGSGRIGSALSFDGTDDYVTIRNSSSLNVAGTNLTISGWVNLQDTGSDQTIFGKFYNSTLSYPWYQYGLEFNTGTQQYDLYLGSSGASLGPFSVTGPSGAWVHVAFAYDGTHVVGYANGVVDSTTAESGVITARTETLHMGRDNQSGQPMWGYLDELRVSSVARSSTWLATEYANQNSPATFATVTGGETQALAKFVVTAVNGGASPSAGTPFAVQVQVQDANGATSTVGASTSVTLEVVSGSGSLGGTVSGTVGIGTGGLTFAAVTYDRAETNVILRIRSTGGDDVTPGDSVPFTVGAGGVSATRSSIAASPSSVEANNLTESTVTVTLRDGHDNPVAGKTVGLVAGGGSSTISAASGVSATDGTVTFTVKNAVAEAVIYSATDTTDGVALSGTATVTFTRAAWYSASWSHRKSLVVHRSGIGGSLTNFPVLISLSDSGLQASAATNGYDLVFTASDGITKLAHQIEGYTNSSGTLVAWVGVPQLSSTTDTTLFMYYGNAASTNQSNAGGVWDAYYKGVWHLGGSSFSDSTTNANHGVNSGTTATAGKMAEGRSFNGSNNYIYTTTRFTNPQNFTSEAWFKTSVASGKNILAYESSRTGTGSTSWDRTLYIGTDGKLHFECWSGVADTAISTATYNDNAWHQAVAVRDDSIDEVILYVDGHEVGRTNSPAAEATNGYWRFGAYKPGSNQSATGYFPGSIDEGRVSLTARSAAWIATQYANQSSPSTFFAVAAEETRRATALRVSSVNGGASPTAGGAFSLVVESVDADGAPFAVGGATAFTLGLVSGVGTLGGTLTGTLAAGASNVTITGVTYTRAESGVVIAATRTSGDSLTAGQSAPFTVVAGDFAGLQVLMPGETAAAGTVAGKTGAASAQVAGSSFVVVVNAVDANWNLVSGVTDTVALTSTDDQAVLPGNTALVAGTTSLSVTLRTAGSASLTAADVGNVGINGNTGAVVTVTAAAADRLTFATQPSGAAAGAVFGQQPVVRARDAYGNLSTVGLPAHLTVSLALESGSGPLLGTVSGDLGTAGGNGAMAWSDLRLDARGTKRLLATATGLQSVTSASFAVANVAPVPGPLSVERPPNVPLKVTVASLLAAATDANGDPVTLQSVATLSTNGASLAANATYVLYGLPPGGNVADRFQHTVGDGETTATGTVTVVPRAAWTGTNFNLVYRGEDQGRPRVAFVGVPGRSYAIQRTSSLSGTPVWTTLITTNAPAGGRFEFVDTNPPGGDPFYRAISP